MSACARLELVPFACLALLAACAGRAPASPCPGPALVLAQAGPGRLGGDAPSQRTLAFRLPQAGHVWAEADGLAGLEGEDRDAAPEVFLDDDYLGPLLPEQGSSWRSPLAVRLSAGWHQLLLRCAQPGGMGPSLRWSRLRVLGPRPCVPRRARRRPRPAPASAARPAEAPVRPLTAPSPAPPLRTDCGPAPVSMAWPGFLKGRDLVLSSPDGHPADSGPLARLGYGQAWTARLKIPAMDQTRLLLAHLGPSGPERARFMILAERSRSGRSVHAVGYQPDVWEPLTFWLCPGHLAVRFAQEGDWVVPYPFKHATLFLDALGLTLDLAPSR